MPSNVRQLLENGTPIYPITERSLVIGLQDAPFEYYVLAWDGASTPVVSKIPAGVVVTYNNTNYTGTLAASATTAPYLYLVASTTQAGEYDRYIVTNNGNNTFSWTPVGSTAPVTPVIVDDLVTNDATKALSAKQGKVLKDELSQFEAEVDGKTTFTLGQIDLSSGLPTASTTRAYSPMVPNPGKVYFPTTIKVSPRYYNAQGVYQTFENWNTTGELSLNSNYPLVRVVVAYSNDATIGDASAFNSIVLLKSVESRLLFLEGENGDARINTDFEKGSISISTGNDESNSTRARTGYIQVTPGLRIICANGYKATIRNYDGSKNYISKAVTFETGEFYVSDLLATNAAYIRIIAGYTNDAAVTSVDDFNRNVVVRGNMKVAVDRAVEGIVDQEKEIVSIKSDVTGIQTTISGIQGSITGIQGSITGINKDIDGIVNHITAKVNGDWSAGGIDADGTVRPSSTTRIYTPGYYRPSDVLKVSVNAGYKYSYRWYDANKDIVQVAVSFLTEESVPAHIIPEGAVYFRLVAAYSDDATISSVSDVSGNVYFGVDGISELKKELFYEKNEEWSAGGIDLDGTIRPSSTTRIYTPGLIKLSTIEKVSCDSGYKYSYRWYNADKVYLSGSGWKTEESVPAETKPVNAVYFRLVAAYSDDATIANVSDVSAHEHIIVSNALQTMQNTNDIAEIKGEVGAVYGRLTPYSSASPVGNCSIFAAKQHTFNDGTPPLYEWFLLADPNDNKLYISRDLHHRTYIATFTGDFSYYTFGILDNGDIIVCRLAASLDSESTDANRMNPFVFKASEGWAIQHEVDFGSSLKPCGWLENCGFTTLPDGTAIFCEYTRPTVATANCWKIDGDPLDKTNWTVTKSFTLSGDLDSGFKHCHSVICDHFTGVCYLTTGDDNVGAMVFASDDNGDTWMQLREASNYWCRMLMMTFTKDYIYWAADNPGQHPFFRAERDNDGVLDYTTAEAFATIPGDSDNYFASYGQCYLPEYDAVLLLDRQDSGDSGQVLPIRVITLSDGVIHILGYLTATDGGQIGFRTRFSEWYPVDGLVRVGFGFSTPDHNKNKVCGNKYPINYGKDSVNNLWLKVSKDGSSWSLKIGTYYL